MDRRLPAANLYDVGLSLIANDRVEHKLDLRHRSPLLALRRRARITDRTLQVAVIAHFDKRQATMLLVVRTETAIIRAAIPNLRVPHLRHFGRLDKLPAPLVILDIGRDQHLLQPMLKALLVKIDLLIANDYLRFA